MVLLALIDVLKYKKTRYYVTGSKRELGMKSKHQKINENCWNLSTVSEMFTPIHSKPIIYENGYGNCIQFHF